VHGRAWAESDGVSRIAGFAPPGLVMQLDFPLPSEAQIAQALESVAQWQDALGGDVAQTLRLALLTLQRQRPAPAAAADPSDSAGASPAAQAPSADAALAASGAQQLKLVSVLFLDVVGSTALSAHLDPEDVHLVMDGALAAYTTVVRAQGGRVLQYAGDNLLAVFGAPSAREDDAERAVLAGLALLAEAQVQQRLLHERLQQQLARQDADLLFAVRVGIHSGDVLLGGGIDGDRTIRGQAVNLAARMEQTAPVGGLRISQATWRLVRGRFDCVEQAPLAVKGGPEPMVTHLVRGPLGDRAQRLRGVDGVSAPLVGREAAWLALQQAWDPAAPAAARQQLLLLQGEPGVGKTRLATEFLRTSAQPDAADAEFQSGRPGRVGWIGCEPGLSGSPYAVLRQLMWALLEPSVAPDRPDGPPAARPVAADALASRWLQHCVGRLGDAGDAAVLGQLLGLDFGAHPEVQAVAGDARLLRDRGRHHAAQLLAALARDAGKAPAGEGEVASSPALTLVIDDVQWCDPATLETLVWLGRSHGELPALWLLLARPGVDDLLPQPGWPQARLRQLDLGALDASAASQLARCLLAPLDAQAPLHPPLGGRTGPVPSSERDDPPDRRALIDLLIRHSEGNPYFMEEVVNALIDRGVLDTRQRPWILHGDRLTGLRLPTTLVGLLQARLDALPDELRRSAQLASVVGPHFWDQSLAALGAPLPDGLVGLVQHALIRPESPSRLPGQAEYRFQTHSLQQVAYGSLLQRERQRLHARVAQWLESFPGVAPHDLLAHHHELGGDKPAALTHWQAAARAAVDQFANEQVMVFADRAMALLNDDDWEPTYELLRMQVCASAVLTQSDRKDACAEMLVRVAHCLSRRSDTGQEERRINRSKLSYALRIKARFDAEKGRMNEAEDCCQQALDVASGCDLDVSAYALTTMAQIHIRNSRLDLAKEALTKAAQFAEASGDRLAMAMVYNDFGNLYNYSGDALGAMDNYALALRFYEQTTHLTNILTVKVNLGYSLFQLGQYQEAKNEFKPALVEFERIGDIGCAATTRVNLSLVLERLGELEEAILSSSAAIADLSRLGDLWVLAAAYRSLGWTELRRLNYDAALLNAWRSHHIFRSLGLQLQACEALVICLEIPRVKTRRELFIRILNRVIKSLGNNYSADGAEEPLRMIYSIYKALFFLGDARAEHVRLLARASIDSISNRISSDLRRGSYLNDVEENVGILSV
jgi:class 3 adenylate cyclase/tetratricopeptide (TPR) repeat protein